MTRAVTFILVALVPSLAAACPACANRQPSGFGTLALIGAMIGVPYAVAVVALRVIRHIDKDVDRGSGV